VPVASVRQSSPRSGEVFTGVSIETACAMGFCAEHAAAAVMVTRGESRVLRRVAVAWDGRVLPPCGRCREFVGQLHPQNHEAEVMVGDATVVALAQLLPFDWRAVSTDPARGVEGSTNAQ
jgi:cytidine deaminase